MSYSLLRWSRFLWFLCKIMWICPVPSKAHLIHIPIFLIKALIFASTPIISHITPWDPTLLLPKNSGQSYEWVSIWPMNWGAKELQIEFLNRMIASIASTTCSYSPIMLRNLMWDMSRIEVVFKSIAVFFWYHDDSKILGQVCTVCTEEVLPAADKPQITVQHGGAEVAQAGSPHHINATGFMESRIVRWYWPTIFPGFPRLSIWQFSWGKYQATGRGL